MTKPQQAPARDREQEKRTVVFDTAATVFAQYGFKRTTMNDIAQAAGISRPALYLMFENKEHLFQELASFRLEQAIEAASVALNGKSAVQERFVEALLVFEKIYYEPVADSPHGEELMDTNLSLATDAMKQDYQRLINTLAHALKSAETAGEVDFSTSPLQAEPFVELLLAAIGGIKKKVSTTAEFRKQIRQIARIFLQSISI